MSHMCVISPSTLHNIATLSRGKGLLNLQVSNLKFNIQHEE